MNVFNCHVNRAPSSGKITQVFYKPGKYLNASLDKASDENERNYVKMLNLHRRRNNFSSNSRINC